MLQRPNCLLVAFLLLPWTVCEVRADRLENNRSAKKKKSNVSSSRLSQRTMPMDAQMSLVMTNRSSAWINSSMSRRISKRPADKDMPVSLVVHGSGAVHKTRAKIHRARAKHAGNAHDILSRKDDKEQYGICCLTVKKDSSDTYYVDKVDKQDAFFVKAWTDVDNNRKKLEKCALMVVCEGAECNCEEKIDNTFEYHEMRTKSLEDLKRELSHKIGEATSKLDRKINEHEEELGKLLKEYEEKKNETASQIEALRVERAEKAQPWEVEHKELEKDLEEARKAKTEVKAKVDQEAGGDYEAKKRDWHDKCGDNNAMEFKLGCCCELKQAYAVVLKPADRFVPPTCLKKGLFTEPKPWFYWSCHQGKRVSGPHNAFFRQCDLCLKSGHIHGVSA